MARFSFLLVCLALLTGLNRVLAQTYYCNSTSPCVNGACCGYADNQGVCGYGPDYCGDTCISNCSAKAECGKYAKDPKAACPLNVCCSGFGFCGTTDEFCHTKCESDSCDDKCQSNCGYPDEPSCSSNDVFKRAIGYYESWSSTRKCDSWSPEAISTTGLTHLYFSFAVFYPSPTKDDTWDFEFMDELQNPDEVVKDFISLKETNPGLSCYLVLGGWAFSDGDTASYWSDMASTQDGRWSFAENLIKFMEKYGFDGVDLDWEYPVASDRGGKSADKENFVHLIHDLSNYFYGTGHSYGLTFTIPASYWYLRNFDVPGMLGAGADWANVMTYDLHGVWDGHDPYIGKVIGSHTNLTEIKSAFDLLWRAEVDPSRLVLGIGFYGRSFTLSDTGCYEPGCPFGGAGNAGPCTNTSGILSYKEITEYMTETSATVYTDDTAAVNYMVWDDDQWVSFDTKHTFQQKVEFANKVCLGGVMIWSVDQDTLDWQALSGLLDKNITSSGLLEGGSETEASAKDLANLYSAYNGQGCYLSDCVSSGHGQCKTGYSVLDYVNTPYGGQMDTSGAKSCDLDDGDDDDTAKYHLICCPTNAMPESCRWRGADERGYCNGGSGTCGDGKYELVGDSCIDAAGTHICDHGRRSLCCNSDEALNKCSWTGCGDGCSGSDKMMDVISPYPGTNLEQDSEMCTDGNSMFCCESKNAYKNCKWSDCDDSCPSDKVLITQRSYAYFLSKGTSSSESAHTTECSSGMTKYCCDPPDALSDPPVDPDDLFKYPDEDNFSYYYKTEESANNDASDDESTDPFAFVMIDGDTDAYDESLVDQWSFLTDSEQIAKRDLKIHKRHSIFESRNDTFDNVVEKYHIKCKSSNCTSIFSGGASNTIVKMPRDTGAGPYARVISLVPLSQGNAHSRSTDETHELTVDYDLAGASEEQKGDVNFRIDYTNLLEYWNTVTDKSAKKKRWFGSFSAWLKKMTTIVKDEKGSLPVKYEETRKLFHAEAHCNKTNLDAYFDIDANIKLDLDAQYAYYFEGAILPKPSMVAAYGYFSVQPNAAILLTMRAEAVMQSHPDAIDIVSGITFPGLSIKGLISVGPELALVGKLDASLSVSGELNAGISMGWDRAEVYFPQDDGGSDASVAPKKLNKDDTQTYTFEPTFDAALTAEGNLDLSLTPEVRFGISVLGGDLMSGYVTAGLENTISLGMSANATASSDGSSSAGFCYWADYIYSVFLRADVSFLNDYAYWGDRYDVASPDAPLALVEKTCVGYSKDVKMRKRDDPGTLVEKTEGKGCFGGLISCTTEINAFSNETCVADSGSDDSGSESKRAVCTDIPAFFYNCGGDFFKRVYVTNQNTQTQAQSAGTQFYSICDNIANYLSARAGTAGFVGGTDWMKLHYISDTENKARGTNNRNDACGSAGTQNTASWHCAQIKANLWPQAVKDQWAAGNPPPNDYQLMTGYTESVSCDEFPFNTAEEGGNGAYTMCVGVAQQEYQKNLNSLFAKIKDARNGNKQWGTAGGWQAGWRAYTMNLVWSSNGKPLANGGDYSDTNVLSFDRVVGGINLRENPNLSMTGANAWCALDAYNERLNTAKNIMMYKLHGCTVQFVDSNHPTKRDEPSQWEVESVTLPENWEDTIVEIPADEIGEFVTNNLPHPRNHTETAKAESKKAHLDRHRSHGHGHGH